MKITNVMTGQVSEYGVELSGSGLVIDTATVPSWLDGKSYSYVAITYKPKKQPADALIESAKRAVQSRKGTVYLFEV